MVLECGQADGRIDAYLFLIDTLILEIETLHLYLIDLILLICVAYADEEF